MILFFQGISNNLIAVGTSEKLPEKDIEKLSWLFGEANLIVKELVNGFFVGPRKEMVTPWSTNAVEITQNMGIAGIKRIEEFHRTTPEKPNFDPMLQSLYRGLDQNLFTIDKLPDPIFYIDDIRQYNLKEGLALNDEEVEYLNELSISLGRKLTDSEVFGFSQVNSEHCRHKIFNGIFVLSGQEQEQTLFQMIKSTTSTNPNSVISAYKDNCAFVQGPVVEQFAPGTQDKPDFFNITDYESVLSIKAKTNNSPTTVNPFKGSSTGPGGEIRDRIAGGKGAFPIAG